MSLNKSQFKRDNHYVPLAYLKRWANENGQIWRYRLLVSHHSVPTWKLHSYKSVTSYEHLYTRLAMNGEVDDIERWFDQEFESPAEDSIRKVVTSSRLTASDWERLVRFLAAQDARTPARLIDHIKRWSETLPAFLDDTMAKLRGLKEANGGRLPLSAADRSHAELLPIRLVKEALPGQDKGRFSVKTVVGRPTWLFSLKHVLTVTIKHLMKHRWTILRSPPGMEWLTSDDPVVRLNYHSASNYNFGGGWASQGTEIFLPLSPHHLMYTKVGGKSPPKGHMVDEVLARLLQRFTVEHAHRFILGRSQDQNAPLWRPRVIDKAVYENEEEQWRRWHTDQSSAERELLRDMGVRRTHEDEPSP